MVAASVATRSFRNLADSEVELGAGTVVVHGSNGAGKTNLIEALFFALTGRSCRTRRERELIRFGEPLARSRARLVPEPGEAAEPIEMLAAISRAEGRTRRVDGGPASSEDDRRRPAVSVFVPDRLGLVKGPPAARRAHLDRLVAALWPARAEAPALFGRALAQRNALLLRVRRGAEESNLDAWDTELAARSAPLVAARRSAAEELSGPFAEAAQALGLTGSAAVRYRPATGEADVEEIAAELRARRPSDLGRGFSGWGPHRDELELTLDGRALRRYGSQGQQRLALLALLFAEREALRIARRTLPLMLLDDVMSELDPGRRERLVALLGGGGQALVTTTEREQVPGGGDHGLRVESGRVEAE